MSDEQQTSAPPKQLPPGQAELPETLDNVETPTDAYVWGQALSSQREQELQNCLVAWKVDHGERREPFDGVRLTGADVSWLAKQGREEIGILYNLHLTLVFAD
jgi:RecB family exonuclease